MEDDASILHANELSYTMVKLKSYLHDFHENISYKKKYYSKNLKHHYSYMNQICEYIRYEKISLKFKNVYIISIFIMNYLS